MTDTRYRKRRGSETQTAVATWFRWHGWPHAEPVGAGRPGSDVTGMPGLDVEVKARRDLNLTAWLRQAARVPLETSNLALVVHRPDGYGPERVADWPVTMTLATVTALLLAAGYGTKED